jgi:hypothetical protein
MKMSRKFEVGDLAITLVSLSILPAGSVVELYKPIRPGDNLGSTGNPIPAMVAGWFCSHSVIGDRLPFAESSLMPLRGDFAPAQQKSHAVPA